MKKEHLEQLRIKLMALGVEIFPAVNLPEGSKIEEGRLQLHIKELSDEFLSNLSIEIAKFSTRIKFHRLWLPTQLMLNSEYCAGIMYYQNIWIRYLDGSYYRPQYDNRIKEVRYDILVEKV